MLSANARIAFSAGISVLSTLGTIIGAINGSGKGWPGMLSASTAAFFAGYAVYLALEHRHQPA